MAPFIDISWPPSSCGGALLMLRILCRTLRGGEQSKTVSLSFGSLTVTGLSLLLACGPVRADICNARAYGACQHRCVAAARFARQTGASRECEYACYQRYLGLDCPMNTNLPKQRAASRRAPGQIPQSLISAPTNAVADPQSITSTVRGASNNETVIPASSGSACSALTAGGLHMTGPCYLVGGTKTSTPQKSADRSQSTASKVAPPIAPWLDEIGAIIVEAPLEEPTDLFGGHQNSIYNDNGSLNLQEINNTVESCTLYTCSCPWRAAKVDKNECRGKNSVCGAEPLQERPDTYTIDEETKFAYCYRDCTMKVDQYNKLQIKTCPEQFSKE
jgi:hypothetical protein